MSRTSHRDLTFAWAKRLHEQWGIHSIPISSEAKRPLIFTSNYWSTYPPVPVPHGIIADFKPQNIAVQTGVASGIAVIDVDDPQACQPWFLSVPKLPPTWTVRTGGGGLHLYFRLPRWLSVPLHKAILWKGDAKHQEVAFICEQGMAVTAPSRFDKKMYKWDAGPNPLTSPPAWLPTWIVQMVIDKTKAHAAMKVRRVIATDTTGDPRACWKFSAGNYSARTEAEFQGDKLEALIAHGLQLASGRANPSGWISCYRPDRDERVPSASVRDDGSVVWTPELTYSFAEALQVLRQG